MAVFRRHFAAEEDGPPKEAIFGKLQLNLPAAHEGEEGLFVDIPTALVLLKSIENVLRGSEQWFMLIFRGANLMKKKWQVGGFRKSGQLRCIVEPHIEQALDAVRLQRAEELAGAFLGKTDAVDLHLSSSSSANRAGWLSTSGLPD